MERPRVLRTCRSGVFEPVEFSLYDCPGQPRFLGKLRLLQHCLDHLGIGRGRDRWAGKRRPAGIRQYAAASSRGDFRSAAAWANIAWGGLTSIAVAAVGITALYWSRELGAILLCMAVVNPVQRFQAFVRRLCYIEGRVDIAALNAVCYALTIFGLLGCLIPLGWLTSVTAIFVWAAASIPAVIFGIAARISPVDVVSRAAVHEVARSLFRSGRWLLGSSLVSWVGSQGVIPLAAMVAGPAGGGVLRALFNIVAPVSVINVAINQLIVPRLAKSGPARTAAPYAGTCRL